MGGRLKEGLLWPLFPPRQWPVNLLDVISCICGVLKACRLGNCIVAVLQVSVLLTTASVKELRSSAATHSPYMETKKMRRRQKEIRKAMMKRIKVIECDVIGYILRLRVFLNVFLFYYWVIYWLISYII